MDTHILDRLADNDPAAIEECFLYVKQWAIKKMGNLDDAEDIAQDTVVEAWRNLKSFRGDAQPSTWLIAIARNVLSSKRRHDRRHAPKAEQLKCVGDQLADDLDYETAVLNRMEIDAALKRLTEDERNVLLLAVHEGLNSEETAQRLGKTANACRLAKARAVRKLGEYRRLLGD